MTDNLVSPSRTVAIGGNQYRLDGSFGTLRAVQEHFDKDIVAVLVGIFDMRLDELASLIAIGAGTPKEAEAIGEAVLDEFGAMSRDYMILKTELIAWLNVALAPKAEREKKKAEMQAMIDRQASPGNPTKSSPSEPSGGSPANSGDQTSGS